MYRNITLWNFYKIFNFFIFLKKNFCILLQYLDDELDSIDDVEKYEKAHNFKVLFPWLCC